MEDERSNVIPKLCKECGDTKDIDEFCKHSAFADGRDNRCKACRKILRLGVIKKRHKKLTNGVKLKKATKSKGIPAEMRIDGFDVLIDKINKCGEEIADLRSQIEEKKTELKDLCDRLAKVEP